MISLFLDVINKILEIANTDVGKKILQIATFTTVIWSGGKLLTISKLLPSIGKEFKFLFKLFDKGWVTENVKELGGFVSLLKLMPSYFAPVSLAISGLLVLISAFIPKIKEMYQNSKKGAQDFLDDAASLEEQLKNNKERIEEINNLSWADKTDAILSEKSALELENIELQEQIQAYRDLAKEKAQKTISEGGEVYSGTSYRYKPDVFIDPITGAYSIIEDTSNAAEKELQDLIDKYGETSEEVIKFKDSLEITDEYVKMSGDTLANEYTSILDQLNESLDKNNGLEDELLTLRNKNISNIQDYVSTLKIVESQGVRPLTDAEISLIAAMDSYNQKVPEAKARAEQLATTWIFEKSTLDALVAKYPEMNSMVVQIGNAYGVAEGAISSAISSIMGKNGRLVQNTKEMAEQIYAILGALLGEQARAKNKAQQDWLAAVQSGADKETVHALLDTIEKENANWLEIKETQDRLETAIKNTEKFGYDEPIEVATSGGGGGKSVTDKALDNFNKYYKDLQHLRSTNEISEEEYLNRLRVLIDDYTKDATANMAKYGTDVMTITRNMYQYEEELLNGWKQLQQQKVDKAIEELEKLKQAVEDELSAYDKLFDYLGNKIDKEIDVLEQRADDIEDYYDKQIAALQETNDQLDKEIQKEEKLDALARAKQQSVLVYKDGKFQYVQDADAVSSAQSDLEKFNREQELNDRIAQLEKEKQAELDAVQAEIDAWEEKKQSISDMVDHFEEEANRLEIEQALHIKLEGENWKQSLANLKDYVNQYNSLLGQLNSINAQIDSLQSGGGAGSGTDWSQVWADADNAYKSGQIDKATADAIKDAAHSNKVQEMAGSGAHYDSASGKWHYATGTKSAHGGLSVVGENGPELRVLGQGDGILPADITNNLWKWGKFSPTNLLSGISRQMAVTIQTLSLPSVKDGNEFVTWIKNNMWREAMQFVTQH